MELYEAIAKRRIVRDFKEDDVPLETIEKIIGAGLKAPTHDHLRNWEFVILHGNSLNPLSSIWCVVENIFLAATAEGLACSMRIPVGSEGPNAARAVGAPDDYMLPCYIGLGVPADGAPEIEQIEYTAKQKMRFGKW